MPAPRRSTRWWLLPVLVIVACLPEFRDATANPSAPGTDVAGGPQVETATAPEPPRVAGTGAAPTTPTTEGLTFVTPPAHPTDVGVGLYLIGLTDVDPPSEGFPKFTGEFFLELEWHDPRLAALVPPGIAGGNAVFLEHEAELMLDRIWWPDIGFENEDGSRHIANRELMISTTGQVNYRERFSGVFRSSPDLRRFPFDSQKFSVEIESFAWDESDLTFHVIGKDIGFAEGQEALEWDITSVSAEVFPAKEVRSDKSFSKFAFHVHATRDSGYYLTKVVIPLMIIIVFNWAIFWMPGEAASIRLERGFVGLLTIVAFHQVISQYLPRIGYMTFMDGVVYLAFLSTGITMVLTMHAQRLEFNGRAEEVLRMDRISQIAFPMAFLISMVVLWFVYHG